MTRWYVAGPDGAPYGPYAEEAVAGFAREGRINGATRVCAEGSTRWVPASDVPQLGIAAVPVDTGGVSLIIPIGVLPEALFSCWLGVLGAMFLPILGPVALLLGIFALRKLRRTPSKGKGRAWVGIVFGSIATFELIALIIVVAAAFASS